MGSLPEYHNHTDNNEGVKNTLIYKERAEEIELSKVCRHRQK